MRMFDRIHRGDVHDIVAADVFGPPPPDHVPLDAQVLRHIVRDCVRVTADQCADWVKVMKESGRAPLPTATSGLLRLPFESMWIEWEARGMPGFSPHKPPQAAAWVAGYSPPEWAPAGSVQLLEFMSFVGFPDKIIYYPGVVVAFIDERGQLLEMGASGIDAAQGAQVSMPTLPAFMAIAIMNCRNTEVIETRDRSREARRPKKGSTRPSKPLIHHEITLPGSPPRLGSGAGAPGLGGGPAPWHLVRGHFKTYTDEAPLMGKHVGTYWWQPAVRGDRQHGVIQSSYNVIPIPTTSDGLA
ncbi:hypothetical protein ACL02S_23850 [Nocardia sp. 004]|uniref:hypothetical protein n=1 Tax=Nocardia sp. 004 TaxID=3385978 RepID=UPI0039A396B8